MGEMDGNDLYEPQPNRRWGEQLFVLSEGKNNRPSAVGKFVTLEQLLARERATHHYITHDNASAYHISTHFSAMHHTSH